MRSARSCRFTMCSGVGVFSIPNAMAVLGWVKKAGWETLLNKAGTTFRKLPDKDKEGLTAKKAIALMLAQPSLIKRPVLELSGGKLLVGFKPEQYEGLAR